MTETEHLKTYIWRGIFSACKNDIMLVVAHSYEEAEKLAIMELKRGKLDLEMYEQAEEVILNVGGKLIEDVHAEIIYVEDS